MIIAVPSERHFGETRVALVPDTVKKIVQWGDLVVRVQSGAGTLAGYPNKAYRDAGAEIITKYDELLSSADLLLMVNRPALNDTNLLSSRTILLCQLDPFKEHSLLKMLAEKGVFSVSLEMIPRSTIAQKMDVLSSQASLAGYMAVVKAAALLGKVYPMMMTPAGTISPSRVFVIGAGVAGLQAIATAKRLGANVSAFDTRAVVEEQVQSLGARFVKLDLGETGQSKDGYAKALTEEQLQMQRELMTRICSQSDVVITTARLFGRKAPVIISAEMLKQMKEGSLVVDLAVDSGGNVEGSVPGEITLQEGVRILGYSSPERDAAYHASQMYSGNIGAFLESFWDKESHQINLKQESNILKACTITRDGQIVHETFREREE